MKRKASAAITSTQAQSIIGGDIDFLAARGGVMAELYSAVLVSYNGEYMG